MTTYNFNLLSDRIKWIMDTKKISLSELARAGGVKPASATSWIDGRSKNFRAENALNLSSKLKISHTWLVTGKGSPEQDDIIIIPDNISVDPCTEVLIKEYFIMFDTANKPIFNEDKESLPRRFSLSLFKELGVEPQNCKCLKVRDDDMRPLVYYGDTVLIDISDVKHIKSGNVYVLAINGETKIRRLIPLLMGDVIVKADSSEITPETLNKNTFESLVTIMGRVIYKLGKGGL